MPVTPQRILLVTALALALAGCAGDEPGGTPTVDADPAVADVATGTPADAGPTGASAVPSVDTSPGQVPAAGGQDTGNGTGPARFDGYGAARFGMSADEVREAWDGELNGNPAEGETCFHLNPAGQPSIAYFALMFGDGEFVRYSVANDRMTAPGGGRRGMDEAEIEALYGDRIERSNHKYVEGGEYLRIAAPEAGDTVLIFETDAQGTVTEWRVGRPPHVDYVEGCA